jgi:hypothetical protein
MADDKQPDYEQQIRHFQGINASNVTNMVNVFLTLAVGVIAFAVNILVTAKDPLQYWAGIWMVSSFVVLFVDTFVGITILFTRMEDYRRTIVGVGMMRDHTGLVTDPALIKKAVTLKKHANRLNKATNILLYVQPVLFIIGFVCLAVSVFLTHGAKLR